MSIADYGRSILRRRWIVLAAMVATVTPALVLTFLQTSVYEASAEMLLQSSDTSTVLGTMTSVSPSVVDEIQILEGDLVRQRLITDLELTGEPPEVVGQSLNGSSSNGVMVTVRSNDARTAATLANAYVQAYIGAKRDQRVAELVAVAEGLQAQVTDLQTRIDAVDVDIAALGDADASVLEAQRRLLVDQRSLFEQQLDQLQLQANLSGDSAVVTRVAAVPDTPVEPTPERTVALALVVGLLLGLGAALAIDYLDDSIRGAADLGRMGLRHPLLSVVPSNTPPDQRPIAMSRPDDPSVEAYRTLRTNVLFLGLERSVQVIQVTSSIPGEGKTTTAANLAVLLSQAGRRVVLVDADLRRPRVDKVFMIDRSMGLTSNIAGEAVDMTAIPISDHLSVIASGPLPPNPGELLSGARMSAVIEDLKRRFDYVVVDCAPALSVSDAGALSQLVDGVIVVVQARRTSIPQLHKSLGTLDQVRAPILGLVLNRADRDSSSYGEYGYGAYVEEPLRR